MRKTDFDAKIVLDLNASYFENSFLDIEVARKLAMNGENLLYMINPQKREKAKDRLGYFFSRHIMYSCEGLHDNKVRLIGTYTYQK